jgi:hypothetical protein
MRQRNLLVLIPILLLSCRLFLPLPVTPTAFPTHTTMPTSTATATTPPPNESSLFEVRIHPEDGLYVGDLVSFEVISPNGDTNLTRENGNGEEPYAEIEIKLPTPLILGTEYFRPFGIGDRQQATFHWVWDTTDLDPGNYELTFRILPEGPEWDETITLFPQDALPPHALDAEWMTTTTECCLVTYLTGTAAARDIDEIIQIVNDTAAESFDEMAAGEMDELHIVLLPRVLGHGGFASGEIYISYLDRNYVGNDLEQVLHHEMIHIIDMCLGGNSLPRILVEGMAVYQTEGHYKVEPLLPSAAALLDLGLYIPLEELSEDFYFHQHEIGYLEAGALVEFMIDQWGYDAYNAFYRDMNCKERQDESKTMDSALQDHFGISFAELALQFLFALQAYPTDIDLQQDVSLTIELFDTIRRYQQLLDPSAYFLTAWLITLPELQSRDITADYLRHPSQPENLTLETLLISAQDALLEGDYKTVKDLLEAVNSSLDELENDHPNIFDDNPLSKSYHEIVTFLLEAGYHPHQIQLNKNSAHVLVTQTGPNLIPLVIKLDQEALQME